jgi:hypothetical protein
MSTIHCPGGHSFSDNEIPSNISFHLIPDTATEPLVTSIVDTVRKHIDPESVITHQVLASSIDTYKCPHCGRLLVFWNGLDGRATSYKTED